MKNTTKFLIIGGIGLVIGILMSFSQETNVSEKVVVKIESQVDTIFVDSMSLPEEMYHYLTTTLELSRNKALGLIANAERESGLQTVVSGDNGTSNGIFQWHGHRLTNLKASVPNWRKSWKAQFQYALTEDVGPKYLLETFSNPQEAAHWWMMHWERPKNKAAARQKNNKFLSLYNF